MRTDDKLALPSDAHANDATLQTRDNMAASEVNLVWCAIATSVLNQVATVEEQTVVDADDTAALGHGTDTDNGIVDGES